MIWLGRERGYLSDWTTQLWVRATGREVDLDEMPWLGAPIGDTRGIGGECFRQLAQRECLDIVDGSSTRGILPAFDSLDGPGFRTSDVAPGVRRFYEETAAYELDAWSHWCGAFRPFGWLLAVLFSRRLQQLNVPLSGLDTSRGLTNDVWHLVDAKGETRYRVWLRRTIDSGSTVYSGSYGPTDVPGWPSPCVRVVFPLPNGNAIVIMKPEVHEDGSFSLTSSGEHFGDPGFYFTVHRPNGRIVARYVRTMRESIRVYETGDDEARADHTLTIWGQVFLRLHYRMRMRSRIEPVRSARSD